MRERYAIRPTPRPRWACTLDDVEGRVPSPSGDRSRVLAAGRVSCHPLWRGSHVVHGIVANATTRRLASLPELSCYPEYDPLLPLRQTGALPEYDVRRLVGQGVECLLLECRWPLTVHEVGSRHAEDGRKRRDLATVGSGIAPILIPATSSSNHASGGKPIALAIASIGTNRLPRGSVFRFLRVVRGYFERFRSPLNDS